MKQLPISRGTLIFVIVIIIFDFIKISNDIYVLSFMLLFILTVIIDLLEDIKNSLKK